ncbi:MAG: hypothetical protein CMA04_006115 [Methanobacteriota archaeon]|nr:MAG: hypothetical protein CMA04_006115 [Euryarchaeota archaeon]|tara:strand:+ start:32036 stop:32287 length:252 start_codon:yes stop_codon:yes gene_type:complete
MISNANKEEEYMSNITLRIVNESGDTIMNSLSEAQLRQEISTLDNEKWIFVDGRMVNRSELANVEVADNATVIVTPKIVAGRV